MFHKDNYVSEHKFRWIDFTVNSNCILSSKTARISNNRMPGIL